MSYASLIKEIREKENPEKAKLLARFFKTGKGQYGEGDLFLGIVVPESRKIAVKYVDLPLKEIEKLLKNKYHEVRLTALLILVRRYRKTDSEIEKKNIYNFYLKNTKYINNWDLVDLSTSYIVGDYLVNKNKTILEKLARSNNLWERRIAIISTFRFIYKGEYQWTFKIVRILMKDKHDLIHKACGWMLREVGKKISLSVLIEFLDHYGNEMPRTMLRYAIEHFPENQRKSYLKKTLPR